MDLSRRGSSVTLDTLLFVVLVGAAVALLVSVQPTDPSTGRIAEETGDVLAASTTTLTVSQSASITVGGETHGTTVDREVHGTYAEMLGAAATADPVWVGDDLTDTGDGLRTAAATASRRALGAREANVEVRAIWRPFPKSALGRTVRVGDPPPRDASVAVATISVQSGFGNVTSEAIRAARRGGYGRVAAVAARAIVHGLFPPDRVRDALHSERADRLLVAHRYRHAAEVLGVDVGPALERGDIRRANRLLTNALAKGLQPGLERNYESPVAAAKGLDVGRVRIVVRAWSA